MTAPSTSRIRSLDIAKGICIVAIVFCHAMEHAVVHGEDMPVPDGGSLLADPVAVLGQFLYTLLFVFFMISGYLHKPGRTFRENVSRRIVQIVPAFVVYTVVLTFAMWLFVCATSASVPFEEFLDELLHSLIGDRTLEEPGHLHVIGPCNVSTSYYFFIVFLAACVPFYALVDRVSDSAVKTAVAMALLCAASAVLIGMLPVHLPFACETAFATAAVMLMGARLARVDFLGRMEKGMGTRRLWAMAVLALAFGIVWSAVFPIGFNFVDGVLGRHGGLSSFLIVPGTLACAFCFMALCMGIAKALPSAGRALSVLGAFSLSIMMFHVFFLKLVSGLFRPIEGNYIPIDSVSEGLVFGTASIALSLALSMAISTTIGKKSRKVRGS